MAYYYEYGDAAGNGTTVYTMASGDIFTGTIATVSDTDWVAIFLSAGDSINVALNSSGFPALGDPYLSIYDNNGQLLVSDDNGGSWPNASLDFVAQTSGYFYLEASSSNGFTSGGYQISVTDNLPVYTYDQIASYLTDGYWNDGGEGRRKYDIGSDGSLKVDITSLGFLGQQLAVWALEAWTDVTGIDFTFVDETFGATSEIFFREDQSGAYTTPFYSGSVSTFSEINISSTWLASSGSTLDSYTFVAYMHEIGHALGLGHSGNYNNSATYTKTGPKILGYNHYLNDSQLATIMSYMEPAYENTYVTADFAYGTTAQISDIIAIQSLYGTNTGQRAGDTTYGENSTAGGYLDLLASIMLDPGASPIRLTVYDSGGTDTLDFRSDLQDQDITLAGGTVSKVYGVQGGLSVAVDTVIENLVAGSGNDRLVGGSANNTISGRVGNDTIIDPFGSDSLDGGAGTDRISSFSGSNTLTGGSGIDLLVGGIGSDDLNGGSSIDILIGDISAALFGNDILDGGTGNDFLEGGAGADEFHFGTTDGYNTIADLNVNYAVLANTVAAGQDFVSGLDQIHLAGFGYANGAAALSNVSDVGGHAVFSDQGTSIVFYNLLTADLAATDFFVF